MTWKKVIAWMLGGLAVLVVVAVALLHVPGILRPVLLGALRAGLSERTDVTVTASRISGSPLSGVRISDLHLSTPGDSTWMRIEQLDVSYRLGPLFLGRVEVPFFRLQGTSFSVARRSRSHGGAFILPSWQSNPDSEMPGIALDELEISGVSGQITQVWADSADGGTARGGAEGRPRGAESRPDGTQSGGHGEMFNTLWTLREAGLFVSDLALGPAALDGRFSVRFDTLHAAFDYAATADSAVAQGGRLAARGAWRGAREAPSALQFLFEAPNSRLTISAAGAPDAASPTGLQELAASAKGYVGLADVEPFFPDVRSGTQVQVDLAARADTASASLTSLVTTSAGGSASVEITAEPQTGRTAFTARAEANDLSPAALLNTFPGGKTDIGFTMDADGWFERGTTLSYAATGALDLGASTIAGWAIDGGRADMEAGHDSTSWNVRLFALGAELTSEGLMRASRPSTPAQPGADAARHVEGRVTLARITPQVLAAMGTAGGTSGAPDSTRLPFNITLRADASGRTDSLALALRLLDSTVGDCAVALSRGRGRFLVGQSRLALDALACGEPLLSVRVDEQPSGNPGNAPSAPSWSLHADLFPAPLHRLLVLADSARATGRLSARGSAAGNPEAFTAHLRLTDVLAGGARIDSVDARATGTLTNIALSAGLFQRTTDTTGERLHEALTVRARYTAASTNRRAAFQIRDIVADSLDVGRMVDLSPHDLRLWARGDGQFEMGVPDARTASDVATGFTGRLALNLAGSRLNRVRLTQADLGVNLFTDSTAATLLATWDEIAAIEGRAVQFTDGRTDANILFSHIDIQQFLPDISHTSDITGSLSVRGDTRGAGDSISAAGAPGNASGAWTATARIDTSSTWNGVALGGGSGQFRMDADRMAGRLDLGDTKGSTGSGSTGSGSTGSGSTGSGSGYAASASFGYAGAQLYADATLTTVPVARLGGVDADSQLSGRVQTNLYFENGAWTQIAVSTDSLAGFWSDLELKAGGAEFTLTPNSLRLDSLLLRGPGLLVDGRGFVHPDASDMTLDLEVPPALLRIAPLHETGLQIAGAIANVHITGPASGRRAVGDVEIRGLRSDQVFFNRLQGRLLAEWTRSGEGIGAGGQRGANGTHGTPLVPLPSLAELTLTSDVIQVVTAQIAGARSRITWDGEAVSASTDISITPTRDITFEAAFVPDDQPPALFLDAAEIRLDGTNWTLASPARLTLGAEPLLTGLIMTSGDRQLSAVSRVRPDGPPRHVLALERIPLGAGADLFGYNGLDGEVSGRLTLENDRLQGTLDGTVSAYGQEIGPFTALLGMDNGVLTLRSELSHASGGRLTAEGTLPLGDGIAADRDAQTDTAAAQTDIRFAVEARDYPIGWTRVFIDPLLIDDLRGTLSGRVDIAGQTESPTWQGAMTLRGGRVGLPDLGKRRGLRYSNVEADLSFRADSLIVNRARATSGEGEVTGSGHMILTNLQLGTLAVDFTANRFLAVDNRDYRTVISGEGRLAGTTDRPRFGGDIRVVSADFFLTDNTTSDAFEPVTLTDEDLLTLQERFGVRIAAEDTTAFDFYRVLAIDDLTVRLQNDTWFRSESNPEMDVQLQGRLDVSKNRNEDPTVFGTITVNPARSQIRQFGRRFALEKGTFTFNGPMDVPQIDLEAAYDVPSRSSGGQEVTIRLLVSGTPEDLTVDFESEPAMELADIVSYIATGRPASESFQIVGSQNESYLQSAAGLAMGPVTDLMENLAASNLGLDVIEITQSGTQGMTLTAGKYVSPKLYVSISQPFTLSEGSERSPSSAEQETQVAMEYEIVRNVLMSLLSRGTILRVNLRWEYAF